MSKPGRRPTCVTAGAITVKSTRESSSGLEKNPDITRLFLCRCCNSCDDVREAYRRRGWAFKNADTIEQCKREGFTQKMQEQKNEGCQVYGVLEVNKVEAAALSYCLES